MMKASKHYTLPEIARQVGISETTARRYSKEYFNYLPGRMHGRMKTYSPECLRVLKRIKQLYDAGEGTTRVHEIMVNEFSQDVGVEHHAPPLQEQMQEPSTRELIQELVSELRGKNQRDLLNPEGIEFFLERLDRIEQRLDDLEQGRRIWFLEENRSWFDKIFRRRGY